MLEYSVILKCCDCYRVLLVLSHLIIRWYL